MKLDWKNKVLYLVKNLPAVTYGAAGLLIMLVNLWCAECIKFMSFILAPFIFPILAYGGLVNFLSSKNFILGWIVALFLLFLILFSLDLFTYLMRKICVKLFGYKFLTKIIVFFLTFVAWFIVFSYLIDRLPIDM